ncbi:hypothetical protein BTO20_20715 [Mycobacterium dioxanotrophicus]|uniref:Uncharacterized protein n=1 Tax=Mycobacterium dioxanotrophicus TaxID=482462 RepID=A0A1Y0C6E8_9MYCO|nr:hypothetical protein BTO20_20715 [Mycobacterium dioxanotrophicus]
MIAGACGGGGGVVGQPKVWRQCAVAVAVVAGVGLAVGVPSALIANPWFVRMTPVPWWSYTVWVLTAVMSAGLAVTFVGDSSGGSPAPGGSGILANLGSALAVGCPVCNKLVVAALGVSGALNVWAPVQPILAAASLSLLGWALWRRISARRSCPVGTATALTAAVPVIDSVKEFER